MTRVLVLGDVVDDISVRSLEATTEASDTNAEIRLRPGGSAANVAAWLGHLGTEVTFVGRVGADAVNRHEKALAAHGVRAHLAADPDLPTATILLHIDDSGERTMFVDRGANTALTAADVPEQAWDDVGWVHLTGYSYFDPATRPVARMVVEQAKQRGAGVSVDPSTVSFLRTCGGAAFLEWIDGVDLVLPNLEEARVLVDARGPHVDLDALAERVPHVVVTLGRMGAAYVSAAVREQVTAPRVDVVDTTGAGDAFAAGFLGAWVPGASPTEALESGRAAAERCVVLRGARPS
ncbi:carbohydrate kinase family protein [Aeromicrobium sp. CTD01-1L150]|uniref:carbohydrate kinase family protein n=1 Tax=Aeromicrobium sp. CTD01-1L150 TaxID=3341830 RepID=UPI0035C0F282